MKLNDKVAIVTGAGGGIGGAIARAFLAEGAVVTAVDVSLKGLEALAAGVGPMTGRLLLKSADATARQDIADVVEATLAKWGRIDILVNNVGGGLGSFAGADLTDEDWDKTLVLNLSGNFMLTQMVGSPMRAQQSGRIINISSSGGRYRSNTGAANIAYAAAKGGVLQLTRTVAHALGPCGITVNAIAPGSVLTAAGKKEFDGLDPDLRDRVLAETPLGYFADPSEIASIAVFLASDDAAYVTGATILANGGWCTT